MLSELEEHGILLWVACRSGSCWRRSSVSCSPPILNTRPLTCKFNKVCGLFW